MVFIWKHSGFPPTNQYQAFMVSIYFSVGNAELLLTLPSYLTQASSLDILKTNAIIRINANKYVIHWLSRYVNTSSPWPPFLARFIIVADDPTDLLITYWDHLIYRLFRTRCLLLSDWLIDLQNAWQYGRFFLPHLSRVHLIVQRSYKSLLQIQAASDFWGELSVFSVRSLADRRIIWGRQVSFRSWLSSRDFWEVCNSVLISAILFTLCW